jgi:hypothetical protein
MLSYQRVSELISIYFQGKIRGKLSISMGFQQMKAFVETVKIGNTSRLETGTWPRGELSYGLHVIDYWLLLLVYCTINTPSITQYMIHVSVWWLEKLFFFECELNLE